MIEGKGNLGLILMKLLNIEQSEALGLLDDLTAIAKRQGYKITVEKT